MSNGAIPAVELAEQLAADAVWLASGCSASNAEAVQVLPCPAVLTVASKERFFGGSDGVTAAAAPFDPRVRAPQHDSENSVSTCKVVSLTWCMRVSTADFQVIPFDGWHAWEPPSICIEALRVVTSEKLPRAAALRHRVCA